MGRRMSGHHPNNICSLKTRMQHPHSSADLESLELRGAGVTNSILARCSALASLTQACDVCRSVCYASA